jgi:hypothetical protein
MAIVRKEIPQQILAAASLGEVQTGAALAGQLAAASNFLKRWDLPSAVLACPLREVKAHFCGAAGTAVASAGVAAHLYLLALVGFGVVLCVRRRGMLPAIVPVSTSAVALQDSDLSLVRSMRFLNAPVRAETIASDSDSLDSYQRARAGLT